VLSGRFYGTRLPLIEPIRATSVCLVEKDAAVIVAAIIFQFRGPWNDFNSFCSP